jgi:hypothetical protein
MNSFEKDDRFRKRRRQRNDIVKIEKKSLTVYYISAIVLSILLRCQEPIELTAMI